MIENRVAAIERQFHVDSGDNSQTSPKNSDDRLPSQLPKGHPQSDAGKPSHTYPINDQLYTPQSYELRSAVNNSVVRGSSRDTLIQEELNCEIRLPSQLPDNQNEAMLSMTSTQHEKNVDNIDNFSLGDVNIQEHVNLCSSSVDDSLGFEISFQLQMTA